MTKMISELLGAEEPLFSMAVEQLEKSSGRESMDVRLTAEIIGRVHLGMKSLGLDPKDTTGRELYQALLALTEKHDHFLAEKIGANDPHDVQEIIPKIKKMAEEVDTPKRCWVLKQSVAKRMLKDMPPKKIMKHLNYRSVDSMLKRENLSEVYGALRFAESPIWLNNFLKKYKKLKPSDFESRNIEFVQFDKERWGDLTAEFTTKKRHNISHLKELGVILILPMPMKKMKGLCIFSVPLILHYINEIRLYSAFFKLKQVEHDFGNILVETLIADPGQHAIMAGKDIHWRVIQRYFGKLEKEYHPEIFQPHVQPEDLHWRRAEDILFKYEPALDFWRDMDYVGVMYGHRPVTFNLLDMAASYVNDTPYKKRAIYHFREALWNEVFARYMGQKTLEKQVLSQLDNDVIEPEDL